MYNGHHLNELMERDHITVTELVKKLNWSSNRQFYQFIDGNPTAKSMELVADIFHVSVDYFFDRETDVDGSIEKKPANYSSVGLYERLLTEKDRRIATLEKLLAIYERDNSGTKSDL